MSLTPKNWDSFQHYKNRAPAWIKLHRGLLDDFAFARLPLASRALAPILWLLASEYESGKITASREEIAFRFRISPDDLDEAIEPLISSGFFVDDSEPLAARKQSACLEEERENKKELEKEKDICAVAGATRTKVDQAFEEFWKARPRRKGADPKQPARKLFLAFMKRGVDPSEIVAGARKWAAADADKIGTEFIPQTVKWLRDERWRDYLETISETTGPPKAPPGAPTHDELIRKYGAKPDDIHGRTSSESGGIRGASGKVREGSGGGGNESLSRHQARIGGMASMGTVLSGISGLRAMGDATSEVRREQADDGSDPMARVV